MTVISRSLLVRVAPACLLVCSVFALGAGARAEEDAGVALPLEPVVLEPRIASQRTDVRWFHDVGDALRIGDLAFAVERAADGVLHVATVAGGKPREAVRGPRTLELRSGKGDAERAVSVHLRRKAADGPTDDIDRWEFAVVSGLRLVYAKVPIDLVDLNGDGRITIDGADGYRAPGNPLTLPLEARLTIGADRLTLRPPTGEQIVATVERLAERVDQRVGLASINALRLRHGLPPVELDTALSDACTAHARYLRSNGWNGYTNPHSEDETLPGYSEAGDASARAGVIMQAGHAGAVRAYFQTYYHRAPFCDPFLTRVGVSTGEPWISVMDATSAAPEVDERAPEWADPILVPADGAIDVETHFCRFGEVPEPATRPARRGFPLTLLFARWDHGVLAVNAELVRVADGEEIAVATLVPEALQQSKLMGIVPAAPLLSGTTYRVRYRLERFEEPDQTVSATFTTRAAR